MDICPVRYIAEMYPDIPRMYHNIPEMYPNFPKMYPSFPNGISGCSFHPSEVIFQY